MTRHCILVGVLALLVTGAADALAGTITGKVDAKKAKYLRNAVVYVDHVEGEEFPAPVDPVTMDQKDLVFDPHVLPVLKGTTVRFRNSDNVVHNVFTPDTCAEEFDLGSWGKGESRERTFDDPGCSVVLLCNVHPEMEAYVLVLTNPYYSITDEEGAFRIDGVPAGTYDVRVWHERLNGEPQKVTVGEEDTIEVAFPLKR